jgi:hypothetical protein
MAFEMGKSQKQKNLQNFFGKLKKGQNKCPFFRYQKTFPEKMCFCEHN